MTSEEASEIISEISFCDWSHEHNMCAYKKTGCSDCKISQAKSKAIDALREKQEREKGCEICNHTAKWFAVFGAQYPHLRARTQFNPDAEVTAETCPMCGRELKGAQT